MKVSPKPTRKRKNKQTEISSDDQDNEIKIEMVSASTSVIRNTKLESMEIEIQEPQTVDGQHYIIDSDNITVESNIEIEFITSDELMPSEIEGDAIDYEDKKYENDFGDGISSQHDGDYENESWENVRFIRGLKKLF